jgi:hypothetical protein
MATSSQARGSAHYELDRRIAVSRLAWAARNRA